MIINSLAEQRVWVRNRKRENEGKKEEERMLNLLLLIFVPCHDQTIKNKHLQERKFSILHCTFNFEIAFAFLLH